MRRRSYHSPETNIVLVGHDDLMVGFVDTSHGISADESDGTNVGTYTGIGADESDAKEGGMVSGWDPVGSSIGIWED